MGRKRKKLVEKSTPILFRLDNETIFKLCDYFNIEYDEEAEVLEDSTKGEVISKIIQILKNYGK